MLWNRVPPPVVADSRLGDAPVSPPAVTPHRRRFKFGDTFASAAPSCLRLIDLYQKRGPREQRRHHGTVGSGSHGHNSKLVPSSRAALPLATAATPS
jgi:hypothetical protein